jgi:tubulin-specific chaperone E
MASGTLLVGMNLDCYHSKLQVMYCHYVLLSVPNAGSFIRPSASISYGTSFLRALEAKYVEVQHGTALQEKVVLGSSKGAIEVEAIGLDKIRGKFANLYKLREVSLHNEDVALCDNPGEISKTCPSELPLSFSFPS